VLAQVEQSPDARSFHFAQRGAMAPTSVCGCRVVQGRMWAFCVIVSCPGGDHDPCMGPITEHGFVEQFITHATVDGEDGPAPEKGPYDGLT
jgi:hypothetical protein